MPPFQTSEALRPAKGFPGMMADMSEWNANSGFIQGTTLRPGHPVQQGSAERTFAPLTTGVFVGILRHHITAAPQGVFGDGNMVSAVDYGHIFGLPGGACNLGGPVYWNQSLNSGQGGYTSTAAGGTRILGAEFGSAATATDPVVMIKVNKLPGGLPA